MRSRRTLRWMLPLSVSASLQAQIITTVAGTDWLFPAASLPALNAPLGKVTGIAVDSQGNVYVADSDNNLVVKISSGVLTVIAGNGTQGFSGDGGPATGASLNDPKSVAVDSAGNVYIADSGNSRIRKVSGGVITTLAGNGNAGFSGDGGPATHAQLYDPEGLAVDSGGNLYIADTTNSRIRKVSGETITTVAGGGNGAFSGDGGPATNGFLYRPTGVAVDSAGTIYIADDYDNRI